MSTARYPDGVSRYAADGHDLETYAQAQRDLQSMRVPVLHEHGDGHARLFVAYFDGTGNDAANPAKGDTNIEHLHVATSNAAARDASLGTFYLRGPGTQDGNAEAAWDSVRGFSYDARLETMYYEFCKQASEWIREDPDARISLANVGFSRGAEQAAGFARMVAERGIQDVTQGTVVRDADGLIVKHRYPSTPLVSGSQIAQAELLFDPVGTGKPHERDRRPPPQVLTGLQITAEDERRDAFKGSWIMDPGFTHGGRFLNVMVGGCHSDIGGSYGEDGLARRNYNLGVDFLNALSDRPFLAKQHLRPDLDVVHRSVEHGSYYDDDVYRRNERNGLPEASRRGMVDAIGGDRRDRSPAASDAEPIDSALDARHPRRPVEIAPVPETPAEFRDRPPARERDDLQPHAPPRPILQRVIGIVAEAEVKGDRGLRDEALDAYLASPYGKAFSARVDAAYEAARDRQQETAMVASQDQQAPRLRAMTI
ncbi:MAG TPA: DUF2235 domain-containing protein [Lysobacter sp.]|nr:DUF2235 domain-containing protein [Lysobacter sp.]